jgi:molybdopterin molybdotransferase
LRPELAGANIGPAGEKIGRDNLGVSRGTVLGPAEIGVLAALGLTRIKVIRRPVAAIIATGEELIAPGKPPADAKIYAGSSFALASQVLRCGAVPKIVGIARDNRLALITKIHRGMKADLVITTGGVSMGDRDLVKEILSEFGEVFYEGIKMAPGKSCAFALLNSTKSGGNLKRVPHFALAGNPTASMIGFEALVRPAIRKMMGYSNPGPDTVEAIVKSRIKSRPGATRFIWVSVEKRNGVCYASPTSDDPRGMLVSLIPADGIAVIGENTLHVEKGDKLPVILLDWR